MPRLVVDASAGGGLLEVWLLVDDASAGGLRDASDGG